MSLRIVKFRPRINDKGKLEAVPVDTKKRAKSLESLWENRERLLKDFENEAYNLFVCISEIDKKRNFIKQDYILFDIDEIFIEEWQAYVEPICSALKIKSTDAIIYKSGNGLHLVLRLSQSITEASSFKNLKAHYRYWLDRIGASLTEAGLPFKLDLGVFAPIRYLRIPGSKNIKPMEYTDPSLAPSDAKITETEVLPYNDTLGAPFKLVEDGMAEPTSQKAKKDKYIDKRNFGTADHEFIMSKDGCAFLHRLLQNNGADASEEEWYSAIGITAWFEDDDKFTHAVSSGHPSYTPEETSAKAEQTRGAVSGPRTCEDISKRCKDCSGCPHFKTAIRSPIKLKSEHHIQYLTNGFTRQEGNGYARCPVDLARYYNKKYPYITLQDSRTVYSFNGKYYERVSESLLANFAQKMYVPDCEKEQERREFISAVKTTNLVDQDYFNLENNKGLINLANGVMNIKTREIFPHDSSIRFTHCLPYAYNGEKDCPTWDLLLDNITCGRAHLQRALEEYVGYTLAGHHYTINKALFLVGYGNNGKSTFLNCIKQLIGQENISSTSLLSIMKDKFAAAGLENKLANFSEEEPATCFEGESSIFKTVTGDGTISVQRKYEQSYDYLNIAKLYITQNELPYLKDTSDGMLRRFLCIPFDLDLKREPNKKIKDVYVKISNELPGILNRCIEAYQRLMERGEFERIPESDAIVRRLHHDSDSVKEWFDTHIDIRGSQAYSVKELYTHYRDTFEGDREYFRTTLRGFNKKLRVISSSAKKDIIPITKDGKIIKGIQGISLKRDLDVSPGERY